LCSRQSKVQFQSNNFSTIAKEYLPRMEDVQSIVAEMEEKFSNANSSDLSSSACDRAGMYIPNPNDSSRALHIEGAILPHSNAVLLLTVVVDELKD
jgi:hypothetical protein